MYVLAMVQCLGVRVYFEEENFLTSILTPMKINRSVLLIISSMTTPMEMMLPLLLGQPLRSRSLALPTPPMPPLDQDIMELLEETSRCRLGDRIYFNCWKRKEKWVMRKKVRSLWSVPSTSTMRRTGFMTSLESCVLTRNIKNGKLMCGSYGKTWLTTKHPWTLSLYVLNHHTSHSEER